MIVFALLAGLMLAGALLWVLFPLFSTRAQTTAGRERQRQAETALTVLREQLAELDAERAAGRVDDAAYARNREELERRALEEGQGGDHAAATGPSPAWGVALLLLVPVLAAVVYLAVGEPDGLDPEKIAGGQEITPEQIQEMVGGLAARLEQEPDNADGWFMLARSYLVLQDFPKALAAYERLGALRPDDPDVLATWADVMAAARGGDVAGEPEKLLERALAIDPNHFKALALAGTAAFQRGDHAAAAGLWERILAGLPPGDESAATIRGSINEARARAGLPPLAAADTPAPAPASAPATGPALTVQGRLAIAETLRAQAAPEDTVFVFVRPAEGGMPVAALRYKVADLPLAFNFEGVPLMSGEAPVPGRLAVVARVSKSGDATPRAGDLEGAVSGVGPDARGVELLIDAVRP
ncbi:c-type cytochrome biogenesis protein CcmI [Pseudothauera rhizosphaerae]|uniref:C-type cytochrome biogenesis protein CcmI n=1 Tax=Pseudothauera rhizosphaerae TaxID=2565932 RepID=A0A4S4ALD8_9RHOO|nr:c-type cytochrome biogenesis protein CcmI [Pseudothauera rhizosphaerae]THF60299.1 c-type cytochrome biogenesis protein CcmI [Pseudothauera rhizosphaerae]